MTGPVHPFLMALLCGSWPETLLSATPGAEDWETTVRDADRHGLTPLLYRGLKETDMARQLPAGLAAQLEEQRFGLAARNMMLANELGGILRAFEDRQLPCAPLRGLALAERLYGDIAARPMGDLDLLVRKEDLSEVTAIFRNLGYREVNRRPGFAQAFGNTFELYKDRHGWVIVEPHWSIAYPPFVDRVDMEAIWNRCVRGQVVGADAWLLSPEDLFVHLCFHLIHRGDSAPLLWFYELDCLLRHEETALDWRQVVLIARQTGLELFVAEVLGKVKGLFDSPMPNEVLSTLSADLTLLHARSVERRLMCLLAGESRLDGGESFALLFTIKGMRAKLRYAVALLFPSPQFMLLHYGLSSRRQLALCYLSRFIRLCWEALKGIGGLLLSSRTSRQASP